MTIGLVSLYFLDFQQKVVKTSVKHKTLESLKKLNAEQPTQLPLAPSTSASVVSVEKNTPSVLAKTKVEDWNTQFQKTFKECFHNETVPETFTDTVALLAPKFKKKELVKSNWHLKLPSGDERRILLSSIDTQNSPQRSPSQAMENFEIRQFAVDNEGLPIPLNKTQKYSPAKLRNLLDQGEVFFKEEQLNNITVDNENVFLVTQNGNLQSIEWYGKGSSFLCQINESCVCRL